MKNAGFGYSHFTMSVWKADAKAFAKSGAHLEATKQAAEFSSQVKILTYSGEALPSWKDAKAMVLEKGRTINYQ